MGLGPVPMGLGRVPMGLGPVPMGLGPVRRPVPCGIAAVALIRRVCFLAQLH
jgi:hypothetical protein